MKTLYIHIGTAKTGTTSIQRFCAENEGILEGRGYCYPLFPHRYPDVSAYRAHFLMGVIKDAQGNRCREQEEKNFKEGMDTVRKLFKTYDNIILSDETVWRGMDCEGKGFWEKMMREAREGGFSIQVIVYLRRQDKYLFSVWNQKIKGRPYTDTFEEFLEKVNLSVHLDYDKKLEKIAAVVGKENITVRIFEQERFIGGTLYSDFLSAVGLVFTDEYKISEEWRNPGLYGNNREIKRVLNGIPHIKEQEFFQFMIRILQECSQVSKEEYACEVLSKGEIEQFLEKYEEGNRKIAREYLLGEEGKLFSEEIADLPKWEKENPYMTDDLARFMGLTMMRLHQETLDLKREIDRQKKIVYYVKHPLKAAEKFFQGKSEQK